jgi:hypothetical protein
MKIPIISFRFPPASATAYLKLLVESHGAIVRKIPSGVEVRITNSTTQWILLLEPRTGQAAYRVNTTTKKGVKP